MKGLILSGGKGTRLRPLTYTGAKQLVPVANKPVLFYAIERLVEAGITDIGIVVGDTRAQIRAAVGDGSRFGATITYVEQEAPLGLAHAVKISQPFLGDDQFVLFLGDNMIANDIVSLVREFEGGSCNSRIMLHRVENPEGFGVVELTADGSVRRLVEKPKEYVSDLVLVGIYMFDRHIFDAIERIVPSARGELEITDAIQELLNLGYSVRPHILEGWWFDTGKMEDMLDVNRLILESLEARSEGTVDASSRIIGKVILEPGCEIINSTVRGPAIIGERTKISDAYVGPFTAIYHDCEVCSSEIEHSIILENSKIMDIPHRIEDSLIGRNVVVCRSTVQPRAYKLMLGDHSRVGILH